MIARHNRHRMIEELFNSGDLVPPTEFTMPDDPDESDVELPLTTPRQAVLPAPRRIDSVDKPCETEILLQQLTGNSFEDKENRGHSATKWLLNAGRHDPVKHITKMYHLERCFR